MVNVDPQFLEVRGSDGWLRKIAYISAPAENSTDPGLIWLPGLKSDMISTKATILARWAAQEGLSLTRFDYSGHGQSEGEFTQGTITRWLDESLTVLRNLAPGPQILVGSSMGGWIALLMMRHFVEEGGENPIRGAVLLAPAWDMTEMLMWNEFTSSAKEVLLEKGVFNRPSEYGEPYAITMDLIEDGRNHLISKRTFAPGLPIRMVQGVEDNDVPWRHTSALMDTLIGEDCMMQLVDGAGHRLSRDRDLRLILTTVKDLLQTLRDRG